MHQTVTNVLRKLVHTNPQRNMTQARDIIDDALATGMHAMQTTVGVVHAYVDQKLMPLTSS
jgi:hypothetical protein